MLSKTTDTLLALASLLVTGAGFLARAHIVPTIIATQGSYDLLTLEELEERADYIVIARVAGAVRQEFLPDPHPICETGHYRTHTPVEIIEVFKGDVRPGDILVITEGAAYSRKVHNLYLYTSECYLPLDKGLTYLLFLKEWDGFYEGIWIEGIYQGKMAFPQPQTLTAGTLDIQWVSDHYRELYLQAMEKYGGQR